jgi:hypothetical protein
MELDGHFKKKHPLGQQPGLRTPRLPESAFFFFQRREVPANDGKVQYERLPPMRLKFPQTRCNKFETEYPSPLQKVLGAVGDITLSSSCREISLFNRDRCRRCHHEMHIGGNTNPMFKTCC